MSDWYYARGGQTLGPVSRMRIEEMARAGELNPVNDLLWTDSMTEWLPAGQVSGIFAEAAPPAPAPGPVALSGPVPSTTDRFLNPYAPPQSDRTRVTTAQPAPVGGEIVPGSEPLEVGQIVKRSWHLTLRNYGFIFLLGVVFFGISIGLAFALKAMDAALGWTGVPAPENPEEVAAALNQPDSPLSLIISNLASVFLSLGLIRIGLNLVSGAPVSIGQLFGEGGKMFKVIVAYFLFVPMIVIGLVALIVPGIYLALRFGQFIVAIVDRDLGIMESFRYSSELTKNNKWNLVSLGFASMLVVFGGLLALIVGVFVAYPMVWLMSLLAYRWMQYGHRAVEDAPGASRPALN